MSWHDEMEKLVDAIERAEGGKECLIKAVNCSVHCETYEEARQITKNSIIHALWDFASGAFPIGFTSFLGDRWAPIGAENDPKGLNKNWVRNVFLFWKGVDINKGQSNVDSTVSQ